MADVRTQRVGRDDLATLTTNQRLIRAFENLFGDVSTTLPEQTVEALAAAQSAQSLAEQAFESAARGDSVSRIAAVVDELAQMVESASFCTSSDLARSIDELKGMIIDAAPPAQNPFVPQYIPPVLLNGWAPLGAPFSVPGYYRDPFRIVRLRGIVVGGTTTANTVIFSLPVGYRPAATLLMATTTNVVSGEVRINASGDVMIYFGYSSYFSFDNISFTAA